MTKAINRIGIWTAWAALIVLLPAVAGAVKPATCRPLSLAEAVSSGRERSPTLAAVRARYQALAAIPSQQGALPDPVLSLGALNLPTDTFNLDQENMTQMVVGLSQKIPFPGTLDLREQSARLEAEAARKQVDEARLLLERDIRTTWWDLVYLNKSLEIIRANQDLLRATIVAARTKYEVGKGLQQDVLLAQVELTKLMDRAMSVIQTIDRKKAALAALLDLGTDETCITALVPDPVPAIPEIPDQAVIVSRALENRPGLLALREKTVASRKRIALAEKKYYPDFTVGASYGYRQDTPAGQDRSDFVSLKLSLNLPIWTGAKQDQAVVQRTSETLAAENRTRAFRERILADIASEYSAFTNMSRQQQLYADSLIPQAEQTAAAMLKGYQVNKVDFLNVIRAQLALYNDKITYWRHLSGAFKALAGLEAAAGGGVLKEESEK